jgi:hypothetical protein
VPAAGQGESAVPAWNAFGTPAWQAPGPASRPAHDDRTVAGLPLRTPGANLIPGSASGTTASRPVTDEAQAPGLQAAGPETEEQVIPPHQAPPQRRSPEMARNRLSGFQLGSREAESWTPSAGEEASR